MRVIDYITRFIYFRFVSNDKIKIECSYCSGVVVFYDGSRYKSSDSPWLGDAAEHVLEKHQDFLDRMH